MKMNKKQSTLNVKVIGGAGAFSNSNASFLIELNDEKKSNILFDCSENTFQYIKRNNIDIDLVFISHTHADHINGLEKLIYFNYFVKNKKTFIIAGEKVKIEKYLPKQVIYENGEVIKVNMYEVFHGFEELSEVGNSFHELKDDKINWSKIENNRFIFKSNHVLIPSYGLLIRIGLNTLIITGDTKASSFIHDLIKTELNIGVKNIHVFHDYQTFGTSHNSVHCCQDDFDIYYKDIKDDVRIKWYLYHNDDFDNENIMKTIKIK